jgi:hypothetical protein
MGRRVLQCYKDAHAVLDALERLQAEYEVARGILLEALRDTKLKCGLGCGGHSCRKYFRIGDLEYLDLQVYRDVAYEEGWVSVNSPLWICPRCSCHNKVIVPLAALSSRIVIDIKELFGSFGRAFWDGYVLRVEPRR